MGEVYRARDTRLGREVAVKVLPASFASDADRLRRFELEARATGLLNHPNILVIYDIGTHEGRPYVVSELLEGETLCERLRGGPLPARKAVEYAVQVANGLAMAHNKGIVHRDLKPENLFITHDDRVKILDFGLAKLSPKGAGGLPEPGSQSAAATQATQDPGTTPGMVLGTVGYMSPEQVRGQAVDHRSDIFSFGAILYEMLTGQRAFQRDSSADTISAILNEDPSALIEGRQRISPGVDRVLRRCLEKRPEQRFQSASDLAFALEALAGTSGIRAAQGESAGLAGGATTAGAAPKRSGRRLAGALAVLILLSMIALAAFLTGRRTARPVPPVYRQLTFRRGIITTARFTPDGQSIMYAAGWDGAPVEIYSTRPESPESRALGIGKLNLLAISSLGEMAVEEAGQIQGHGDFRGILARVPLAGGVPREILDNVVEADWTPDGKELAVTHVVAGKWRLEFPIGKVLYETSGWISRPRISPQRDKIAFLDHPYPIDDRGSVAVVDLMGNRENSFLGLGG